MIVDCGLLILKSGGAVTDGRRHAATIAVFRLLTFDFKTFDSSTFRIPARRADHRHLMPLAGAFLGHRLQHHPGRSRVRRVVLVEEDEVHGVGGEMMLNF